MANDGLTYETLAGVHESTNEEIPGTGGASYAAQALAAKSAAEAAAATAAAAAIAADLARQAAEAAAGVDPQPLLDAVADAEAAQAAAETAKTAAEAAQAAAATAQAEAEQAAGEAGTSETSALAAQSAAEAARTAAEAAQTATEAARDNAASTLLDVQASAEAALNALTLTEAAKTAAEGEADFARSLMSALPGQEVEPGLLGPQHYLNEQQLLIARAPSLQGRTVTGGSAGTNNLDTVITDFFTSVVINRASGVNTLVRPQSGQWLGPPDPPNTLSWAWIEYVCIGDGYLEIQGPSAGSVTVPATKIAEQFAQVRGEGTSPPAASITFDLAVPAGSDRVVVAKVASTYQAGSGFTPTVGITGVSGLTTHETGGNGLHSNASPILASLHSATISGTAPATVSVDIDFPAGLLAGQVHIEVWQDCGGVEDADLVVRASTATSEDYTASPANADSVVSVMAVHHGGDANPVSLTPNDSLTRNTTGSRDKKDFANAMAVDSGVGAAPGTWTGSSAKGGPAVIMGIVLQPITRTTGGTGTFIVDSGWSPIRITKGQRAVLRALSDGLTWMATRA